MNVRAVLITFTAITVVKARPGLLIGSGDLSGYGGGHSKDAGGEHSLEGIPNLSNYGGLHYPNFELQDLGTIYEGQLPPKIVKISNTIAIKIPKPYPVKIPHNIPIPYPVPKPFPVPVPQLIKVPHPVPVEVVKNVPVPVEVPKPYPVPVDEYKHSQHSFADGNNYGGHQQFQQHFSQTSYEQPAHTGYSNNGGYETYQSQNEDSNGHQGNSDESVRYPSVVDAPQEENAEMQQGNEQNPSN